MNNINAGKVVSGGLVAGVVLNVLDSANNYLVVGADFAANATRLGLDPATMETPAGIATWVIIDFLLGILLVWTYASIRPRFGPGPKTAIYAGLIPYLAINLILFGLSQGGLIPMAVYVKLAVTQLFIVILGAIAGAWAYKES